MQIILLERIVKLGQIGDVVSVRAGYARNFLLPQKKALRATAANMKYFEQQRQNIEARNAEMITAAEAVAGKAAGAKVVLLRQAGEVGQLYGSVTARDIAAELRKQGIQVRRGNVVLDLPIKAIGISKVHVSLHADVVIEVDVNVARSAEEAEAQVVAKQKVFESEKLAQEADDALSGKAAEEEVEEEKEAAEEAPAEAAAAPEEPKAKEEATESSENKDETAENKDKKAENKDKEAKKSKK